MRSNLVVGLLAATVLVSGAARAAAQPSPLDDLETPAGPAPRFVKVLHVNEAKGEVLFRVQVVSQGPGERPVLLMDREGNKRMSLGSKPSFIVPIDGFRVKLASGKWSSADGKEIAPDAVATLLKPGVIVLLSADGKSVDPAYLQMFKQETLVLIVPAKDLPIPYMPLIGSSIPIKQVD